MKSYRLIALAGVMAAAMAAQAQANILISLNGTTPNGGNFIWSYEGNLQTGAETTENAAPGPFATFFTLYDIAGLIPGSETMPADWTVSEQLLGINPDGLSPADSGTIMNITWTYVGTSQLTGPLDLGAFTFESTEGNHDLFITYGQQDTKDNPGQGDDDTELVGLGSVIGPSAQSLPEPLTLSLFGAGLAGAAAYRRRKLRTS